MFARETSEEIGKVAEAFGIEPAALLAVAAVESASNVFAVIDGRREPLIRFEGHYFDRRLSGEALERARAEGLASPQPGTVRNHGSQAARWRLVERAAAIDRQAAYESVSWGLGQVMGAHWAWLGFADVDGLVAEAREGAAGQARLMARFIEKAGLAQALRDQDWEKFAHGYNGPGFRKNDYHVKLAAAYRRYASGETGSGADSAPSLLGNGSSGEAVRSLQQKLSALGYPLVADGIFGNGTEEAVRAFQRDHGLGADGLVGPGTRAAIDAALPFGEAGAGWWKAAWRRLKALAGRR